MMEKLLALAGGGSGGGGSSDFSTCTMTVLSNEAGSPIYLPQVMDVDDYHFIVVYDAVPQTGETITLPLYKGALLIGASMAPEGFGTVSGAATVDPVEGLFVTGDFSVSWG